MAEKDTQTKGKVKNKKAIFDFKELYGFVYDWLNEEGYKVKEKTYSEEINGKSKKIDLDWEADKKISDYFKFRIKLKWQILGMKDVEVQREGEKVKKNKGDLEIKFEAVLVKDYEHRWENNALFKFLRGLYDQYIIRSRVDEYETKLIEETNELIAQIKSFLTLEGKQ